VRVVAVAEHGDIDQVRRRRILPDLGIDVAEVDLFVEPTAGPLLAGVGNEVREAADVFVLARFQPIAPDHLHGALLATIRREAKKQPRRVIVAFARALVERAADRQFDVPPPREHRVGGKVDIDMPKQHRSAVMGFEPHAGVENSGDDVHAQFLKDFKLSEPIIYPALAEKLGVLPPELLINIAKFYTDFQRAKAGLPLLVTKPRSVGSGMVKSPMPSRFHVSTVVEPAIAAVFDVKPSLNRIEVLAAVAALGSPQHMFLAPIVAHVGIDPSKDINWVVSPSVKPMQLFIDGKLDGFLGLPPEPQELHARRVGDVIVNSTVDRPWSQYFCCMLMGHREFVRKYPIATKRVTRAILKAADLCATEPERAARLLVDGGFTDDPRWAACNGYIRGRGMPTDKQIGRVSGQSTSAGGLDRPWLAATANCRCPSR
jgi:hypothetical protein